MSLILRSSANKNARMALITAEYCGVQVEIAPAIKLGVNHQKTKYFQFSPLGEIPLLETPDGSIFETSAILCYISHFKSDNTLLLGSSPTDKGHVNQWIDFAFLFLDIKLMEIHYRRLGLFPNLPPVSPETSPYLKKSFSLLDTHLAGNTYLVGHSVTLADIITTCILSFGFTLLLDNKFTSDFPHVERYFWDMVNLPNFKKVLGNVKQINPVTKMPSHPNASKPNEYIKESSIEAVSKMPSNKMTLDEWKKFYSKTRGSGTTISAIEGFWDMYDQEKYSLWFCDSKYNNKNTDSLEVWIRVCGFPQKMDPARRYAFGKMLVIGSEPPFKVKGLWLFPGQEISQFITDDDYEWQKVDISDNAQKMCVNQMIKGFQLFEGKPVLYDRFFR